MNINRALCLWAMNNGATYVYASGAACWGEILYCAEKDALFHKLPDPAGRDSMTDNGYYAIPYDVINLQIPGVPDELVDDDTWPLPSIIDYAWETGQVVPTLPWIMSEYTFLGSDEGGSVFTARIANQFVSASGSADVKGTMYVPRYTLRFDQAPDLP